MGIPWEWESHSHAYLYSALISGLIDDDACPSVNEAVFQVAASVPRRLVSCTYVPAAVHKFASQPGLDTDCLVATDMDRCILLFPAAAAELSRHHTAKGCCTAVPFKVV